MNWIAPEIEPPDTHDDDPRIGHLLARGVDDPSEARVVIAGFPSDEGVRRNGGRAGASDAPDAIRRAFYGLTPDPTRAGAWRELLAQTVDLGNLALDQSQLAENQKQFGRMLSAFIDRGTFVIVLGGGHETAYAHFLAYGGSAAAPSIVNIDAHLDVRPLIDGKPHSGSPFRQAIEGSSPTCASYTVLGALRHSVAESHARYVTQHGQIHWGYATNGAVVEQVMAECPDPTMVTFDMDAVDQSAAPGVSAPAVGGLKQSHWLKAAYLSGKTPSIRSVDVCEVNPRVDVDGRTAKLAALTLWRVLDGFSQR